MHGAGGPGHNATCSRSSLSAWAQFSGLHCAPELSKDTQRAAVPRLNELAGASPQQQHFSKHIFNVQQHARPWPGHLSRVRWRQPLQPPQARAGPGHSGDPEQDRTKPLSYRRGSTAHYQIDADRPSARTELAGPALGLPPPRVLARPCGVRSTAVLTRRGSRVPRPGACVHTHAHARAHPDAPGAPAPLRFPAAPRRPGPHLRWR